MKDLVFVCNNEVVVSSRKVAEVFKREHKNILAAIRHILVAEKSATNFYQETKHTYRGRVFSEYVMGRDGFMLLVMGFNTKDAIRLKKMFIDAFNDMEAKLKGKALQPNAPTIEDYKNTIQKLVDNNHEFKQRWKKATPLIRLGLLMHWIIEDERKAELTYAFVKGLCSND